MEACEGKPVALKIGTNKEVEATMRSIYHPPKQLVRAYLERRARDPKPPPSLDEVRRQLGWGLGACKPAANRS